MYYKQTQKFFALVASLLCHPRHLIKIIIDIDLIAFTIATFLAFMGQNVFLFLKIHSNRLHHSAAYSFPIPRMNIDMLAPQTLRTMIGKSIALYFCIAMLADKILYPFLKRLRHLSVGVQGFEP